MRLCFLCFLCALLLAALPALAQPPAESCGVGDSLDGGDALPVDVSLGVMADDFVMTGAGCDERGFDHVTCLTPASSCTVDAQCSDAGSFETAAFLGLQVAINAVQGACSTSPATCLDSDSGTGLGAITGLALTGGTTYCFVCEVGNLIDLRLEIQATSGDCGALPVELRSFEIE